MKELETNIPVDLIIFDLDGTLTDSIPAAVEAIQAMMAELKYPPKTKAEIDQHVGFGETPLVAGSIGSNDPAEINKAMGVYFKHYLLKGVKNVPLFPHVKEVLETFKKKIKVIVSNKRDEFIRKILKFHNIYGYFPEILGGDTSPCLKPDPCAILALLKKYKVNPGRTIFVGDMKVDIETGKNAGIRTCGVTYGFDGKDKLLESSPDILVDDLLELKKRLK